MTHFFTILILSFSLLHVLNGQRDTDQKYWVFFKDKKTQNYNPKNHLSEKTIHHRKIQGLALKQYTDIPITPRYLRIVGQEVINVVCHSKWLNAVSVYATPQQIEILKNKPFVSHISLINARLRVTRKFHASELKSLELETATSEMNSQAFVSANLTGKNITIGVIDAGFYNAHRTTYLKHLFENNQILGFRDFVNPDRKNFFAEKKSDSDNHGTDVLSLITGKKNNEQRGLATEAQFYLARTEDGTREARLEEDYWISAVEWMDSLGVRLISTSLGYSYDFDDPKENYEPKHMDGKTTKITQMAQLASEKKGILIVVSAGNEGFGKWQVLSAPADAQGVLSVGATNQHQMKAFYSSIGTESLPYIKPEVSCYSQLGTSFSAPVIAGFVACLMQKSPNASLQTIKRIVERSAKLYPHGNNFIGYGIPNAQKALHLLDEPYADRSNVVSAKGHYELKPNHEGTREKLILFHKKDQFRVVKQARKYLHKKSVLIKPIKHAQRTTLVRSNEVIEIIWEKDPSK